MTFFTGPVANFFSLLLFPPLFCWLLLLASRNSCLVTNFCVANGSFNLDLLSKSLQKTKNKNPQLSLSVWRSKAKGITKNTPFVCKNRSLFQKYQTTFFQKHVYAPSNPSKTPKKKTGRNSLLPRSRKRFRLYGYTRSTQNHQKPCFW